MNITDSWIVVADSARARIFQATGPNQDLMELHDLVHPESQLHEGDLRTGGKGEVMQSKGTSMRQSDPQTTTMEKHADRFAKELADFLRQGRVDHQYETLVLAAEPKLLGRLREKLDAATAQTVTKTIDKNWAQHGRDQIQKQLKEL